MMRLFFCPQGHSWEGRLDASSASMPSCPACGATALPPTEETFAPGSLPIASSSLFADSSLPIPLGSSFSASLEASCETFLPTASSANAGTPAPGSLDRAPPPPALSPFIDSDSATAFVVGQSLPSPSVVAGPTASATDVIDPQRETWMPPTGGSTVVTRVASPTSKVTIPGYEILGELGRGTMGVVYRARQVKVNRVVALKMILAGGHAAADDLARFQREAEAVARLQHPNIVQLFEAGEVDGRPFFALEFVDGGTLQKRVNGQPQPARLAAELLEALARAIHYAHERGIIHRDLKPANILLQNETTNNTNNTNQDRKNESPSLSSTSNSCSTWFPKITDFGLAKRLDSEIGQTASGDMLGTPAYMAPEQASGRPETVGPSADVYALGAILYELLTGRPPLRGETVWETLKMVRSLDPVPVRRLQPKCPRDLETICLKCLQKDSHQRYASALDLAEDLRRFLDSKPIKARPVPAWERAAKWCRRRPAAAALIAVSTLAVFALGAGGWAFASRETHRAEEATRLQLRAQKSFRDALSAVEQMLTRVGQERLAHQPRMEQVRRDLLLRALSFYEHFLGEHGDDRTVRWETARARSRVGDIQEMLGDTQAAEAAYRAALSLFTELTAENPAAADYRHDRAACHNNLGNLLRRLERLAESEEQYREALDLREGLASQFPDEPGYAHEQALGHHNLAVLLQTRNQFSDAQRHYQQALATLDRLVGENDSVADYRLEQSRCRTNLGELLAVMGRTDEAEAAHDAARTGFESLTKRWPTIADYQQELAGSHNHLGNLWRDTNPAKAERSYRTALALRTALAAEYPTIPAYRQEQANTCNNLAICLQAAGKQKEADDAFRQGLEIKEALAVDFPRVPEFRRESAGSYNNLAILLQQYNRFPEAEKAYRSALERQEKLTGEYPDRPLYAQDQATTALNLAALLLATGRADDAVKACRQAHTVRQELANRYSEVPGYRHDLARAAYQLASVLEAAGQLPAAEMMYREAAGLFEKLAGQYPGVPDYRHEWAIALNSFAKAIEPTRPQDAEQTWRQALRLLKELADEVSTVPVYRQERARCLNDLATFLASNGRGKEAEETWNEAIVLQKALAEKFPAAPSYRQELARSHGNKGILFAGVNRTADAEESYKSAITLQEGLVEKHAAVAAYWTELLGSQANLATLLTVMNRRLDAEKAWRRLVALDEKRLAALPGVAEHECHVGNSLIDLAEFYRQDNRPDRAMESFEKAVGLLKDLRKRHPEHVGCRAALAAAYLGGAETRLLRDSHAEAGVLITSLAEAAPAGWPDLPKAGGVLARCVGVAAKDKALPEPKRQELAQKYGDEAVKLLRRAIEEGYKDREALKDAAEFEAIRSRPDFQKLLSEGRK